MKSRKIADFCKNAIGTMFLMVGAFFVCSTLLSMRAVLADPIAPVTQVMPQQSVRTGNVVASPRNTTANRTATTSRAISSRATPLRTGATSRTNVPSRGSVARTATSRVNTPSRGITTRGTANRTTATRTNSASRTVAARTTPNVTARVNKARTVSARTANTNASRVSLQGNAIRGSRTTPTTSSYLASKLYTGNYNYSNIVDSSTGMISADAYNNCLESYYTCMDEICTARNAAQGRCSCAARTKAFKQAENQLQTANEELIVVSGELALLVATKGKDVTAAFQLTEAEQVMNCVSWQEMHANYEQGYTLIDQTTGKYYKSSDTNKPKDTEDAGSYWCHSHNYYGESVCSGGNAPNYCKKDQNNFGFDVNDLKDTSSSSDILAQLKSWADAKDSAKNMILNNDTSIVNAFGAVMDITSGLGLLDSTSDSKNDLDTLSDTWGYDLFQMAHNDVCGRVLDSCFNGIYEACGTLPQGTTTKGNSGKNIKSYKCANGAGTGTCPFNYNSIVSIDSTGDVSLHERGTSSTNISEAATASCFGYTTSTDPYATLRGPVADARRSIMMKYLLDANAACDVYGEQLQATAQNIGYQKTAAQQALQQKRLEFANEEIATIASEYQEAVNNFSNCLSDLYQCYIDTLSSHNTWSTARIKTYCATIAQVPSCYEPMVCDRNIQAIITVADNPSCAYSSDYRKNTCRNVVTLAEILNGTGATATKCPADGAVTGDATCSSAGAREYCMQYNHDIEAIRQWSAAGTEWSIPVCGDDEHVEGTTCAKNRGPCPTTGANVKTSHREWNLEAKRWGGCVIDACEDNYGKDATGAYCVPNRVNTCDNVPAGAKTYHQELQSNGTYGPCVIDSCDTGYTAQKTGNVITSCQHQ